MTKPLCLTLILSAASFAAHIPAGTPLTVRLVDPVDSRTHEIGHLFRATVDEPVVIEGATVLPRGTEVRTKLVEVNQPGRFSGKAQVTLVLASIEKDGRSTDATSSELPVTGKSRMKTAGAFVGGSAALGAVIGGIAGGGVGAVFGAASGAGAGGAYQLFFKKGHPVRLAPETRLTFTIAAPIELTE